MRAFDATDLTNELWNSQNNCVDQVGSFAKYVPPTVANGKVYLVTFSNQLLVYGLLSSRPAANPGLVGSVRCDSSTVNLTAIGSSDWAKWPNYVHKATGGAQISNYTFFPNAFGSTVQTYTNDARTLTWSDGTPTVSGSDQAGIYTTGYASAFAFTAPADTTRRTLYVYVAGTDSGGRLTAQLSDNSAPAYVDALSGAGPYDAVYTLSYVAASAGQRLTVTWTQDAFNGRLALQGAALASASAVPPSPTSVTATNGTSATTVTVSWAASAGATSYSVYRSTSSGTLGTSIGTSTTTSFTDSTPVPGTVYYYSVVASGAGGNSAPSVQVSGYAAALPPPPIGVSASQGTSATSVTVSWAASAGATSYTVYRSTTNGTLGSPVGATNLTTLTDSTVVPGTVYFYAVAATNVAGTSAASAQNSGYAAVPPPSPPTGISASDGSSATSVTVSWAASTNATSYTLYRSTASGQLGTSIGTTSTTTLTDATVTPGVTYYYSVTATGVGGTSAASPQNSGFAGVSLPSPPTGVSASDGTSATSVTIRWTASANATSYNIYRSSTVGQLGTWIGSTSTTTLTATVTPGVTYYYSVTATGVGGTSAPSAQDSGYAGVSLPSPPTGVSASDGSSATSVTVSWAASTNATSYTVYRSSTVGQLGTSIGSTSTTTLTDATVTPGVTYYYSVTATGVGGTSAASAQNSGFAAVSPPSPPTGVSASDGSSATSVTVSWAASTNATSYTVYRSTANGQLGTSIGTTSTTTLTDAAVTPGVTYYYSVTATGVGGTSAASAQNSGFAAVSLPSPPTGVSASDGSSATSVTVSWAASTNATSYTVYRSTANGQLGTSIGTTSTTTLTDATVTPGVTYYYSVTATGVGGTSAPSAQDSGYAAVSLPSPPTGVSASDGSSATSVTVSWAASTNATSYTVYRSSSVGQLGTSIGTTSTTTLTDATVTPGVTYYYSVTATGVGGTSAASAQNSGYAGVSPPSPPTGISASDGSSATSVTVSWAASTNATSYTVYRSSTVGQLGTSIGSTSTTTLTDATVTPGVTYYYSVTATGVGGTSAASAQDSGFAAVSPPSPPTGVSASDGTSGTSVTIRWTASANATNYNIYRSTADGQFGTWLGTTELQQSGRCHGHTRSHLLLLGDRHRGRWHQRRKRTGQWLRVGGPLAPQP